MLFIQDLSGLVKGLRANKDNEHEFIQSVLKEIKNEIRSADMHVKSVAVLKLSYLEMLGFDISWSAFPIIETASSNNFHFKSIGYLAASLSFSPQTDVMMLMPNLLKKDLISNPSVALSCFSIIATKELCLDLAAEISRLTTHNNPSIRKKAIAAILTSIKQSDDFDLADFKKRLKDRLQDTDQGVVSTTVSTILELASLYPAQCLTFAPSLYTHLTQSSNNWMVIKILKLFAILLPHEQRLHKKLYAPIADLIESTTAVSVLYECVLTCIVGGMLHKGDMAEHCMDKLTAFLSDDDHNLKYAALLGIAQMLPTHAHLLEPHQDDILSALDDADLSIRLKALQVVSSIVTAGNVEPVMNKLFEQLVPSKNGGGGVDAADALKATASTSTSSSHTPATSSFNTPAYTRQLAHTILDICTREHYTNIPSFAWLVNVIVQLSRVVPGVSDGPDDLAGALQGTLVEIAVTYPQTRAYTVSVSVELLEGYIDDISGEGRRTRQFSSIERAMLPAAIFIIGEYAMFLDSPHHALSLLNRLTSTMCKSLPRFTVGVALVAAAKVFGIHAMLVANAWDDEEGGGEKVRDARNKRSVQEMSQLAASLRDAVRPCYIVNNVDIKDRASMLSNLLEMVCGELRRWLEGGDMEVREDVQDDTSVPSQQSQEAPRSLYLISSIYFKTPGEIPDDEASSNVDLDTPIIVDMDEEVFTDDQADQAVNDDMDAVDDIVSPHAHTPHDEDPAEERRRRKERKRALKAERASNPYYIKSKKDESEESEEEVNGVDDIPIIKFEPDAEAAADAHVDDAQRQSPNALFYPKTTSRPQSLRSPQSLKSASTPPLHTSSSQSSLGNTSVAQEPQAISTGSISKVVKKKKSKGKA